MISLTLNSMVNFEVPRESDACAELLTNKMTSDTINPILLSFLLMTINVSNIGCLGINRDIMTSTRAVTSSSCYSTNKLFDDVIERVGAMVGQKTIDATPLKKIRRTCLSSAAQQRILERSLNHQKKWEAYAIDEAHRNLVFYGGDPR